MSLREFLVGTILMSFALITANAHPAPVFRDADPELSEDGRNDGDPVIRMPLPTSPVISKDKVLESAYFDTLTILSSTNTCSDFFGGPLAAVDVFAHFMGSVRKDYVKPSIAMEMHGPTTYVENVRTKVHYRLFAKVSINGNGPFYRRAVSRADHSIARIGRFDPDTDKVRVLILLHELGHVMKGQDGNWLLPDDGNSEELSLKNSRRVEDVCGELINNLGEHEGMKNLARQKLLEEKVALDVTSSGRKP